MNLFAHEEDPPLEPFAPLIGQKAQGCWLGHGSALFLEFGEAQPGSDLERNPPGE
jgi:hypothetical protein